MDKINPLQLFIFTNVIGCSRLPIWVGYFIYLKFTRFSSLVYQLYIFSSINKRNWLINRGIFVLLFDVFKHLLLRKTDVLKTCQKSKIWRNALALKCQKVQGIFGKLLFWHYYLQLSFVYKIVSHISFKLFCLGDKKLLSDFLTVWGWFQWHKERFLKYLG